MANPKAGGPRVLYMVQEYPVEQGPGSWKSPLVRVGTTRIPSSDILARCVADTRADAKRLVSGMVKNGGPEWAKLAAPVIVRYERVDDAVVQVRRPAARRRAR